MNQPTMNETIARGKWNQLKGQAKQKFGKLTDDDLMKADGVTDQMIGLIQERYGYSKERAQSEWTTFLNSAEKSTKQAEATVQQTATKAADELSKVTQNAKDAATNALDQGKKVAAETFDEVKQRADSVATDQQQKAVNTLQGVAGALHTSSDELRKNDQETFADYADAAATYVDDFSAFLRQRNPTELWQEVQSFAHRQPEVFVLGTLAAGFLLGRFLRSSGTQQGQRSNANAMSQAQSARSNPHPSARQPMPNGQTVPVQSTTNNFNREHQAPTAPRSMKASETNRSASLVTPSRPENRSGAQNNS